MIFKTWNDLFKKKKSDFNREHGNLLFMTVLNLAFKDTLHYKDEIKFLWNLTSSYPCLMELTEVGVISMTTGGGNGGGWSFYRNGGLLKDEEISTFCKLWLKSFFVGTKGNEYDVYYLPVRQSLLNMMDINR